MELTEEKIQAIVDKGYIKIYKNTRGFNWEIKAFEDMDTDSYKELINKVKELNSLIEELFTV